MVRAALADPDADLALLRISKTSEDGKTEVPFFSFLEIAEEPALRRGDRIYTLGVPLGIIRIMPSPQRSCKTVMVIFKTFYLQFKITRSVKRV